MDFEKSDCPSYDWEPPPYGVPGRIFVHVISVSEPDQAYPKYETEILDHDRDTSVFWIDEGTGWDYWFDQHCDFEHPGFYVLEGVCGEYIRGDGYTSDDDEEWDFERIRKATVDELMIGRLL